MLIDSFKKSSKRFWESQKDSTKSPRFNKYVVIVDSPPISSRPSGRSNECIVINSSSSYKVQQKDDYGADTKWKGKEKLVEDHYPHDSDFEDDIPLSKRLRVNNDQDSKNVDGGSVSKGMNGLSQKWTRFVNNKRKKASQVPLKEEDFFNMSMIYLISTFILSSPLQLSHIPKDHFLCVESGQYITYPWGNLSFFNLRHSISSQMAKDPDYVKFEGFPLALQIWFYECCNKVDGSIAIRKSNRTPRIFNWDISKNKIYFDHLQKGMFRKYGNQYTFEDLVFMDEELDIIESENLPSKRDRPVRQNQNLQTHSVERQNAKDLPHSSAQKVGSDPSLSFNKDLQKIAQEVVKVRNELEKFEKNVDAKFVEMKDFMDSSFKYIIQELKSLQNDVSTNKDLGGERVVVEDQRKGNVDVQNEHLQDCGDEDGGVSVDFEINRKTSTLDDFVMPNIVNPRLVALKPDKHTFQWFGVIEGENTFISPVQLVRSRRIRGKYAQSPYTNLSESVAHRKTGSSLLCFKSIDPPFEFGVGRVDLMDWFHPLAYRGDLGDLRDMRHVDVIMYYLKFCNWVVQIHDAWEANDKDESLISIHHEVAQYIRGDRILANTPWVDVDHVCIQSIVVFAFHGLRFVFSIRKRCLYIYDSLNGYGVKHTNAITSLVKNI
ncbi:hypothetical protein H5410_017401 [Solanum commersonii]|uniref:Ulp1 protease family, C-terminal catalytic domain containing protein n=1 Tax=Solanum commersonii TaxID=4109 RepID=A0A9J5ZZ65_SOLCO|nr:hypothetical protein H5410_017401 [Solanum commersonii]